MAETWCRVCGRDLKVMAVCVSCGKAILFGCPNCSTFSDTQVHVGCLYQLSVQE